MEKSWLFALHLFLVSPQRTTAPWYLLIQLSLSRHNIKPMHCFQMILFSIKDASCLCMAVNIQQPYTSSGEEILYILWWIFIFVYLYLYMYILYLLRWEDIAFYFWSKVEEIEFHGLLGVGHIQRHHFRRLSMVFISDHPWLIIYNVLSIHGWSKVKPVKNDDVIHEQPLIRPA